MSKLQSLRDAINKYVTDGDVIYAAGFTHLIPFAAGHEIIRQGKKNLTLARATPDLNLRSNGCSRVRQESYFFLHGKSGRWVAQDRKNSD